MMNPFEDDAVSAFGGGTNGGDFYIHFGKLISGEIKKEISIKTINLKTKK